MWYAFLSQAFGRLGLAASTAFNAANYLDRFLSINCHLQRWETWMVELVSLACLSIACKLDEVIVPSLHHLQVHFISFCIRSRDDACIIYIIQE